MVSAKSQFYQKAPPLKEVWTVARRGTLKISPETEIKVSNLLSPFPLKTDKASKL